MNVCLTWLGRWLNRGGLFHLLPWQRTSKLNTQVSLVEPVLFCFLFVLSRLSLENGGTRVSMTPRKRALSFGVNHFCKAQRETPSREMEVGPGLPDPLPAPLLFWFFPSPFWGPPLLLPFLNRILVRLILVLCFLFFGGPPCFPPTQPKMLGCYFQPPATSRISRPQAIPGGSPGAARPRRVQRFGGGSWSLQSCMVGHCPKFGVMTHPSFVSGQIRRPQVVALEP